VHIDWATLAEIAVVAAAAALTVVLLVAFALVGSSTHTGPVDGPEAGRVPVPPAPSGRVVAVLCVLTSGLIVSYGLYLIIA
jgi:hypothetical protein